MKPPTTGAHLQQYICAPQLVEQAISNLTNLVTPLHDFTEHPYDVADKRTKRAVSPVLLPSHGWGRTQLAAFAECKTALAKQVNLAD